MWSHKITGVKFSITKISFEHLGDNSANFSTMIWYLIHGGTVQEFPIARTSNDESFNNRFVNINRRIYYSNVELGIYNY